MSLEQLVFDFGQVLLETKRKLNRAEQFYQEILKLINDGCHCPKCGHRGYLINGKYQCPYCPTDWIKELVKCTTHNSDKTAS